jgi:hypothetical protein
VLRFTLFSLFTYLIYLYQINANIISIKIVTPIIYEDETIFGAIQVYIDKAPQRLQFNINT